MSRILTLIALVLSCACLGGAQVETSRERAGLRGPVRNIQVESAKVSSDGVERARIVLSINSYDRTGNTIRQTMNNPDGSLKWKYGWRHTYDPQGREIRTDYYNARGVLTSTGITLYDDHTSTAQVSQHNPNGSINHIREISFDDRFNKVREVFRYPSGMASVQSSSYNSEGKPTEVVFGDVDGNLKRKVLWSYDDHGNPIGLIFEEPDGKRQQQFKKSMRYDENGNVVETLNYRTNGTLKSKETFAYEFDAQGNWTRRTTVRELFTPNGSARESEVTYRRITYF